jgi:Zn-dependent M28 family amino/carboxypeptidase
VRSITPTSLNTPHTGALHYGEESEPIPAAAITLEDAARFHRWAKAGVPISVQLELGSHSGPDATSHNVIGEVLGRVSPEEIVLVGCHLDSWDVGQGAQDDAGGCSIVMEAARLIGELPIAPRRTVRVVLFTNEENGLRGAAAYAQAHAGERHVAALESDTGTGLASGFRVDVRHQDETEQARRLAVVLENLSFIQPYLEPLSAGEFHGSYGGADISPLVKTGTVGFGVDHDTSGYWPIHHTHADTVDKVDPAALRQAVAAVAVLVYALAENPDPLLP